MRNLSGERVLVVEDDYFEATHLAARLSAMNIEVVGPVPDVDQALELINSTQGLAGAILDINLNGQMVFPVADALKRQGVPFVFATGYDRDILPPRHDAAILLQKPLDENAVVVALVSAPVEELIKAEDAGRNGLLARLQLFEFQRVSPFLQRMALPRGVIMERSGQPIRRIYFPIDCIACVLVTGGGGDRIEAGLIGYEGMTGFGIADGDGATPFEVVNQVEGTTFSIAADDFRQVLQQVPKLRLLAIRFARSLSIQVSYSVLANGRYEIPNRLARLLLMIQDRLPSQGDFCLTHDYLAMMLGVRRPSVTTALHLLEGQKLIRSTRAQLEIIDRKALIGLAGGIYGTPEEEYIRLMNLPYEASATG